MCDSRPGSFPLFLIYHPVQINTWPVPGWHSFLFVGFAINYQEIETFSGSFETQLYFMSRNQHSLDSIQVVGFSPCFNLGSLFLVWHKRGFLSGYKINTYYQHKTFSGAQEVLKVTFGTDCLSQFLRNQFNHRRDVYKKICNVHMCVCFIACFLGWELKTWWKRGQAWYGCSCHFIFTLDPCKILSKEWIRFLDREDSELWTLLKNQMRYIKKHLLWCFM